MVGTKRASTAGEAKAASSAKKARISDAHASAKALISDVLDASENYELPGDDDAIIGNLQALARYARFLEEQLSSANDAVADLEDRKGRYISAELVYSSTFWFEHLLKSGIFHTEHENVTSMVENLLCNTRALFWLEIMSLSGNLSVARSALIEMGTNALVSHVYFISQQY